jgi:DNA-binding transcriptional LysR family regulator
MSGFAFDLIDLRLFLRVVEAGSITAGARASHLSLAAASARVLGMEAALAIALLTRGRRGVQPTEAGLALAKHARDVLLRAEQLRLDLEAQARGHHATLTLLGTSAAIREYLPDALADFLVRHADVNIVTAEASGEDAVQAVLEGAADIAFVTERTSAQGLESFEFILNGFALVVPRGHALAHEARGRAITIASADACDIVGLPEGSALQDTWDARAAARGVRLNYRVRVPSFDAQARLIERGVGVAMMPDTAAQRFSATMALEALPLSDPFLNRRLLLCVRRLDALPPVAQALVAQLLAGRTPGPSRQPHQPSTA